MDSPPSAPDDFAHAQFSSSGGSTRRASTGSVSRLAIVAFVLSLAGVFLSAGLAATILGVISLRRIHRSGNLAKGRRLAIAAIVLSIMMVPLPALVREANYAHALSADDACVVHLAALGKAMPIYANDHDDRLPTPSQWCDLLMSTGAVDRNTFQCPATCETPWPFVYPLELYFYLRHEAARQHEDLSTYAMNEYLQETSTSASPDTVLLFDARPGWNQTGGPNAVATGNHAGRGAHVLFMDTHVEFISADGLSQLRWKPSP